METEHIFYIAIATVVIIAGGVVLMQMGDIDAKIAFCIEEGYDGMDNDAEGDLCCVHNDFIRPDGTTITKCDKLSDLTSKW